MAPGRVAVFLPLALGRSLAPSNRPVICRLECFRGRHAGPVEKGQQLGSPQPGDARVWVDPHVEVAQAATADGSLFRPVGASGGQPLLWMRLVPLASTRPATMGGVPY